MHSVQGQRPGRLCAVLAGQALARPSVGVEDVGLPLGEPAHRLQQLALGLFAVSVVGLRPRSEEGLLCSANASSSCRSASFTFTFPG